MSRYVETLKSKLAALEAQKLKLLGELSSTYREIEFLQKKVEREETFEKEYPTLHLQEVHLEQGLSENQKKKMRDGLNHVRTRSFYGECDRLQGIKEKWNRQAVIEIRRSQAGSELRYHVKIFRDEKVFEDVSLKTSKKDQVRMMMDLENRPVIPWKSIDQGNLWTQEILLSPAYLEEKWAPENVLPIRRTQTTPLKRGLQEG